MASWDKLKDVVGSNFKITKDDGNVLWLVFEFEDGSDRVVIVARAGNDQIGEWAQVEAPFALMEHVDLEAAVRKSSEILCGAISCNDVYATLRHSVPLQDLDAEEILIPINAIVASANAFANEFGEDADESDEEADDDDEEEEDDDE